METCVDTLMTAMKLSIGAFVIVLTIALIIITMIKMIVMNLLIIMIILLIMFISIVITIIPISDQHHNHYVCNDQSP